MTAHDVNQEINRLVNKIIQQYQPERIYLYGSQAWGSPSLDSDVDLLVLKKSSKKSIAMMRDIDNITFDRQIALDTLVYTPEQYQRRLHLGDPFVQKINTVGKLLYDRSNH